MVNPNIRLATPNPPPRSPERQAPADVIERRNVMAREIEAARAAHAKARAHRYDAQCCLEKARADAELAMSVDVYIAAVRSGDIAEEFKAIAVPSDNIDHLERDIERWQNTETACRARVTELERDAQYILADSRIDDVIKAEANV